MVGTQNVSGTIYRRTKQKKPIERRTIMLNCIWLIGVMCRDHVLPFGMIIVDKERERGKSEDK